MLTEKEIANKTTCRRDLCGDRAGVDRRDELGVGEGGEVEAVVVVQPGHPARDRGQVLARGNAALLAPGQQPLWGM